MLDCLTYVAFVYWAVVTVHTVLPIDVAVCGASAIRGGLGACFNHAFGGDLDVDLDDWRGFPCNSGLMVKMAFVLRRPAATVRHALYGGGQHEPFVPILFVVPLIFMAVVLLRRLGLTLVSDTAARTFLKFGIAVGCRAVILLQSILHPTKESVYYKRYSKVEFCIIAWTAYIIELPVWHEALVSVGTAVLILFMCGVFPHHMLPEVNPLNVVTQAVAAAAFAVGHSYYQQRRRALAERAARAARSTAKAAAAAEAAAAVAAAVADEGYERQQQQPKQQPQQQHPSAAGGLPVQETAGASSSALAVVAAADGAKQVIGQAAAFAPTPTGSATATATAAASSLAALRRIQALRTGGRSYISPARPCRFALKIQHSHLSDLPPNLLTAINQEVLAGSGWQAVGAYAREGCVELVLDLRPIVPIRTSHDRSNAADDDRLAEPDQDRPGGDGDNSGSGDAAAAVLLDAACLRDLGRSIVSYLHSTGAIRPDSENSILLQMGSETVVLTWQPEAHAWVVTEVTAAGTAAAAAPREAGSVEASDAPLSSTLSPPTLLQVSPRVAEWPGSGACLHLSVILAGPSKEEVLAGRSLVVRSASCMLSYSVLQVQPQPSQAAAAPPPLRVELAVSGVAASGLVTVEAKSSTGLLSAAAAVVVDYDAAVISGLKVLAAAMDDASVDAMLQDYGTWLDLAMDRVASAAVVSPSGHEDTGVGGSGGGKGAAVAAAANGSGDGNAVQGTNCLGTRMMPSVPRPSADVSCGMTPYLGLHQNLVWGQSCSGCTGESAAAMLAVAADLLGVCCRGGSGAAAAVAAVADRLIACVLACDDGGAPAAAFTSLLDAVPAPPTNAGALHMAVAAGSRPMVELLVRWHERLYGRGGAAATAAINRNLWLARASCGVTPLHVVAAMPDGGAMAAWLLYKYDTAAAAWEDAAVASHDGMTPAALVVQLGGRWRLRLWLRVSGVVRSVRRILTPPAPLARVEELLWGFRDLSLERQFAESINHQAASSLVLYAAANALLPLLVLAKAIMYGSSETATALAALAFHVPHAAPLLAWVCQVGGGGGCSRVGSRGSGGAGICCISDGCGATTAPSSPSTATHSSSLNRQPSPPQQQLLPPRPRPQVQMHRSSLSQLQSSLPAEAAGPARLHPGRSNGGEAAASAAESWRRRRLRSTTLLAAYCACRAGAKAVVGLSLLWPFSAALQTFRAAGGNGGSGSGGMSSSSSSWVGWGIGGHDGGEMFLARGGDIALEAVVRPLLEQVDFPVRLLLSLLDFPAMWLLYRGVEERGNHIHHHHTGGQDVAQNPDLTGLIGRLTHGPLERTLLYQAVLLATTAAVSISNRVRFLRAKEGAWASWLSKPAATTPAAPASCGSTGAATVGGSFGLRFSRGGEGGVRKARRSAPRSLYRAPSGNGSSGRGRGAGGT